MAATSIQGDLFGEIEAAEQPDYYDGCQRRDTAYADRLQTWSLALDVVRDTTLAVHEPAN